MPIEERGRDCVSKAPDYSTYSLEELLDAKNHVSSNQYPERAAAIVRPTGDTALAEELVALIADFPGLCLVNLDPPLAHQAVQVATHHRLRGADSVYVAVAEAANATLITHPYRMLPRD